MTIPHATVIRMLVIVSIDSPVLRAGLYESLGLEVFVDALSLHSISKENCDLIPALFVLDSVDRCGDEFHMSPLHIDLHVAALYDHLYLSSLVFGVVM